MRKSSRQMCAGSCFRIDNVSYMLGQALRTCRGKEYFNRTRPTRKSTFTPSQKNMSQILRTEDQGRLLENMHRNHSVMYSTGSILWFLRCLCTAGETFLRSPKSMSP